MDTRVRVNWQPSLEHWRGRGEMAMTTTMSCPSEHFSLSLPHYGLLLPPPSESTRRH